MGKEFHPAFGKAAIAPIESSPPPPVRQHNLSFVEDSEQIQAQSVIDNELREFTKCSDFPEGVTFREHARLTRYFCAVRIHIREEDMGEKVRDDGSKYKIYLPDSVRAEDKYQSCVGLVISLGPQAFQDKEGNPRGCSYRVGDWIVFPRTDIMRMDFCGLALGIMTDDRAVVVTDDPRYWTQGQVTFKA